MITEAIYVANEIDLLEAHLEQHRPWGWRTVVVEAERSHSGMPKPLFFHENRKRFERFDVEHIVQPNEIFSLVDGPLDGQYRKFQNNDWARRTWMQENFDAKNPWIFHSDVDEILAKPPEDFDDVDYVGFNFSQYMAQVNRCVNRRHQGWRMTRSHVTVEMLPKVKKHSRRTYRGGWHFTACPSSPEEARFQAQVRPWTTGSLHPNEVPGVEHYEAMWGKAVNFINSKPLGENWVVPISELPPWMQDHTDQFPIATEE